MARRVRVGDVIEIPTRVGFGYAQLTHVHPTHGALLRVLPGAHEERPTNLLAVVAQETDFVAFFPLEAAVNRGIVEIVGGAEIPASARAFPPFKAKDRKSVV